MLQTSSHTVGNFWNFMANVDQAVFTRLSVTQKAGGIQTTLNIDYMDSLHHKSAEYHYVLAWKQRATAGVTVK